MLNHTVGTELSKRTEPFSQAKWRILPRWKQNSVRNPACCYFKREGVLRPAPPLEDVVKLPYKHSERPVLATNNMYDHSLKVNLSYTTNISCLMPARLSVSMLGDEIADGLKQGCAGTWRRYIGLAPLRKYHCSGVLYYFPERCVFDSSDLPNST